jgi:hypothetical protein
MDEKANDTYAFDLDNRLDNFFSDAAPSQQQPPEEDNGASNPDNPLNELKSIILAIDWEITEDTLDALLVQVGRLLPTYEADKASRILLKILNSLGKYLRSHKSNAHPDAIMQIMSVYSSLEKVITDDSVDEADKQTILSEAVKQFTHLKTEITGTNAAKPKSEAHRQAATGAVPTIDVVIKAIEDLKSMITTELESIRTEIAKLKRT